MQVSTHTVKQAIRRQQLKSVDEVIEATKAGSNCGGCIRKIEALLPKAGTNEEVSN